MGFSPASARVGHYRNSMRDFDDTERRIYVQTTDFEASPSGGHLMNGEVMHAAEGHVADAGTLGGQ